MKIMGKRSLFSLVSAVVEIGWYGAIVLLVLSAGLLLVAPWVDPPRIEVDFAVPAAFRIEPAAHPLTALPARVENVHLDAARGSLHFSPRSSGVVAWGAIFLIAVFGVAIWVLGQFRAVFRTLRDGHPFVADNATRIRRIGYAVILAAIGQATLDYIGMHYTMTHFSVQGLRFEALPTLNIVGIMCGLIILVIAEVFREGTRLDEEQSLTV
jgi:hypothetical protein